MSCLVIVSDAAATTITVDAAGY